MSAPLPFFLTFLHLTHLSRSVQRSPSLPFLRKRRASTQEDDIDDIFSPFLYYFCPPIKREYPPFPFSRDIASCFDRDVRGREREGGGKNIGHCFESERERRDDKPDYIHDRWCRDEYLPSTPGISWRRGEKGREFRCFLRNRMRISFTLADLQGSPLFIRCNLRREIRRGERVFLQTRNTIEISSFVFPLAAINRGTRNLSINQR